MFIKTELWFVNLQLLIIPLNVNEFMFYLILELNLHDRYRVDYSYPVINTNI